MMEIPAPTAIADILAGMIVPEITHQVRVRLHVCRFVAWLVSLVVATGIAFGAVSLATFFAEQTWPSLPYLARQAPTVFLIASGVYARWYKDRPTKGDCGDTKMENDRP